MAAAAAAPTAAATPRTATCGRRFHRLRRFADAAVPPPTCSAKSILLPHGARDISQERSAQKNWQRSRAAVTSVFEAARALRIALALVERLVIHDRGARGRR